jgi:hypothetical protein
MPQVKSRYNGLIVTVPADARGVIGRFHTQGGNELIFEQNAKQKQKAMQEQDEPVKVKSEAPDPGSKDSGNQHEADIA